MKTLKIVLPFFFLFWSSSAFSQIEQGSLIIRGSLSFLHQSSSSNSIISTYNLTPSVGYFFTDRFAGGLGVGVSGLKTNINNTTGQDINRTFLNVAPFVRNYFLVEEKVALFGELNLPAEFNRDIQGIGVNINLGSTIFITPRIALDARLNLLSYKSISSGPGANIDFFSIGPNTQSVNIGAIFFF